APVPDLLEMADARPHGQHRLDEPTVLPLPAWTPWQVGGGAGRRMPAGVAQDQPAPLHLAHEPLKGGIRDMRGGPRPPPAPPPPPPAPPRGGRGGPRAPPPIQRCFARPCRPSGGGLHPARRGWRRSLPEVSRPPSTVGAATKGRGPACWVVRRRKSRVRSG